MIKYIRSHTYFKNKVLVQIMYFACSIYQLCKQIDSYCGRTSQVIGPTCTCPCPKDLKRVCMCTKQLNRICPSVPRTPDKPLTTKMARLSNTNHTHQQFAAEILLPNFTSYKIFTVFYRSDYKSISLKYMLAQVTILNKKYRRSTQTYKKAEPTGT